MKTIKVEISNGGKIYAVNYTMAMFELLKTDNAVNWIMDNETGELLYVKPV